MCARNPALAQQHHLDALTLLGGYFPSQRCFQPPDLALGAFDHLFPSESDDLSESHLASRRQFTATFGTRYPKHFDSISYGSGMRLAIEQHAQNIQFKQAQFPIGDDEEIAATASGIEKFQLGDPSMEL